MQLFHHPFCPHSRFVRLVLGEYGINADLIEENVLARRPEFLELNPAGTTPVLVDGDFAACGALVIAEYIDETQGITAPSRLMPIDAKRRAEARRLMIWFHEKFFAEVSEPLVREKILKRRLPEAQGGGPQGKGAADGSATQDTAVLVLQPVPQQQVGRPAGPAARPIRRPFMRRGPISAII